MWSESPQTQSLHLRLCAQYPSHILKLRWQQQHWTWAIMSIITSHPLSTTYFSFETTRPPLAIMHSRRHTLPIGTRLAISPPVIALNFWLFFAWFSPYFRFYFTHWQFYCCSYCRLHVVLLAHIFALTMTLLSHIFVLFSHHFVLLLPDLFLIFVYFTYLHNYCMFIVAYLALYWHLHSHVLSYHFWPLVHHFHIIFAFFLHDSHLNFTYIHYYFT